MRKLRPEDADEVAALELEIFPDEAMNEGTLRTELRLGQGLGVGEPLVGYLLLREEDGLTDITRLGVLEEHRQKGLGEKMLRQVLRRAPDRAFLFVRKHNMGAYRLYRKHGFRVVGQTERSWVMFWP